MCQSLHEGRSITRTAPLLLTYSWLQIISKVPGVSPVSNQIIQVPKMEGKNSPINPIVAVWNTAYLRGTPTPKMALEGFSIPTFFRVPETFGDGGWRARCFFFDGLYS